MLVLHCVFISILLVSLQSNLIIAQSTTESDPDPESDEHSEIDESGRNLTCHYCDRTKDRLCKDASDSDSHCDTFSKFGCIYMEYWNKKSGKKVAVEQRCMDDTDLHGKWNLLALTHDHVHPPPDKKKKDPKSKHNCLYFTNLNNGELVEKCVCKKSYCNSDMLTAGGIGDVNKINLASRNSSINIVVIVGCVLMLLTPNMRYNMH